MEKREQIALLILRVTLGVFLLFWSSMKVVQPGHANGIASHFYGMSLSPALSILLGVLETLLSLLIIAGAWKRYSYGTGLIVHGISTVASWRMYFIPFPPYPHPNDLFVAAIPVLGAFIALYALRDRDVLWAVQRVSA
jgi:putative oxidoreductase